MGGRRGWQYVCRGVVVKEKGKSFCRAVCVESKSIQVVWEFLKSEEVVFQFIVFNRFCHGVYSYGVWCVEFDPGL